MHLNEKGNLNASKTRSTLTESGKECTRMRRRRKIARRPRDERDGDGGRERKKGGRGQR
jgi:hypothetical protein